MNDAEWKVWVAKHSSVFGFFTVEQLGMINAWRPIFASAEFTADELLTATELMARKPPRFPSEHLGAIQNAVKEMRAVEYRKDVSNHEGEHGKCTKCGGSGCVNVPLGIKDGNWVPIRATRSRSSYYTQSVLCDCPLGRWKADRFGTWRDGSPRRMLPLRIYELNNPNWREQMQRRHEHQLAVAESSLSPKEKTAAARDVERLVAVLGSRGE